MGCGAQTFFLRHLAFGQVVEHLEFSQLLFGSFLGARGRSRHAGQVQRHVALVR